jgi:hypothetical protein
MEQVLYFAIFKEGERAPMAAFASIEDAFDWACGRFGSDPFSIRAFPLIPDSRQRETRHCRLRLGIQMECSRFDVFPSFQTVRCSSAWVW